MFAFGLVALTPLSFFCGRAPLPCFLAFFADGTVIWRDKTGFHPSEARPEAALSGTRFDSAGLEPAPGVLRPAPPESRCSFAALAGFASPRPLPMRDAGRPTLRWVRPVPAAGLELAVAVAVAVALTVWVWVWVAVAVAVPRAAVAPVCLCATALAFGALSTARPARSGVVADTG